MGTGIYRFDETWFKSPLDLLLALLVLMVVGYLTGFALYEVKRLINRVAGTTEEATTVKTKVIDRWNNDEDVTDKVERQEVGYRFQQQRPDMPTPRFLEVPVTEATPPEET